MHSRTHARTNARTDAPRRMRMWRMCCKQEASSASTSRTARAPPSAATAGHCPNARRKNPHLGRDRRPAIKGLRPPEHHAGQLHPDHKQQNSESKQQKEGHSEPSRPDSGLEGPLHSGRSLEEGGRDHHHGRCRLRRDGRGQARRHAGGALSGCSVQPTSPPRSPLPRSFSFFFRGLPLTYLGTINPSRIRA